MIHFITHRRETVHAGDEAREREIYVMDCSCGHQLTSGTFEQSAFKAARHKEVNGLL